MSGTWGQAFKLCIFGESHGPAIGIVINGLPPGIKLDMQEIAHQMQRRRPGTSSLATKRFEADEAEVLSGMFEGFTTGAPLCAMIKNTNTKSQDYEKTKGLMRPSHADYAAYVKYHGFADYRGGGHFSGRITAPLVFAGAVARQVLKQKDIVIGSHVVSIKDIKDEAFDLCDILGETLETLSQQTFPVINHMAKEKMEQIILDAKQQRDSVGGIIECAAVHVEAGAGDPFFDSLESVLSCLLFSIPGVKGVEFGAGFAITNLDGSQANDAIYKDEQESIKTKTNHNGGINGGISNGMPIVFRAAIKPTPSIEKQQDTINMQSNQNQMLTIEGRHDPCIVSRAAVVIESVAAIGILDRMLCGGLL